MYGVFFLLFNGLVGICFVKKKNLYKIINQDEKKSVYTCLVMLLMSLALQAKDKDVAVAEALLKRLLPSYIESFQFQKLKGEKTALR